MANSPRNARPSHFVAAALAQVLLLLAASATAQVAPTRETEGSVRGAGASFPSDAHYIAWLEKQSMLHQADRVSAAMAGSAQPWQSPYAEPRPRDAVAAASVWVLGYAGSVITRPGQSVIDAWADPQLWQAFQEIGIDLLHTGPVKLAGGLEGYRRTPTTDGWFDPVSLHVDPQIGTDEDYRRMVRTARTYGGSIADDIVPLHTGKGPDFRLAERAYKNYAGMYIMVEIPEKDWRLLPPVSDPWKSEPLGRKIAQRFTEMGYLPGLINSNDAVSNALELSGWDVTAEIPGVDGKTRRWAYLHFFKPGQPTLNWLDPSAAAQRVIAGNLVKTIHNLGARVVRLDAVPFLGVERREGSTTTWHYQHPLSVWGTNYLAFMTRRLGGWTFQELNVPLGQLKPFVEHGPDLSYDFFTRTQVVHSLLTGDASLLRQAYQFLQAAGVPLVSLVHDLQNHDEITYQLPELSHRAKESFTIRGKTLTGAELRERVLDTMRREAAGDKAPYNLLYRPQRDGLATTFAGFVAASLAIRDPYHPTPQQVEQIKKAHLLLAFANAMQPGVFSLSGWDLVGALPLPADTVKRYLEDQDYRWVNRGGVDLLGANPQAIRSASGVPRAQSLYGSLPEQLKDPNSFASQLKQILTARKRSGIALGELLAVPEVAHPSLCVLAFKLENDRYAITALNFGREPAEQRVDLSVLGRPAGGAPPRKVTDALTGQGDDLVPSQGVVNLRLDALSGRTIVFEFGDLSNRIR